MIVAAVGILGIGARLIRAWRQDEPLDMAAAVAFVLVLVVVLFAVFDWRTTVRTRQLRKDYPGAFVAQVVTTPKLADDVDYYTHQLTGGRGRVAKAAYLTLVADRDSIRMFGGSIVPRERATFPSSSIVRVVAGSEYSGVRNVPCLDVFLAQDGHTARLKIHLYYTTAWMPRFVPSGGVDRAVVDFTAATAGHLRAGSARPGNALQ